MLDTLRQTRLFRLVNAIRHEGISSARMVLARRHGFRYRALDPGLLRQRVHYNKGSKRYQVVFPNGREKVLTVTVERSYQDIDGRAHLWHYSRALRHTGAFGRAIDCACGSGYGSAFLANHFDKVLGVDIDPSVVSYASERYRRPNLAFLCADAGTLPAVEPCADLIVSIETMEHVAADAAMVEGFYRLLRPGGVLYITVPNSPDGALTSPFHVREYTTARFTTVLETVFGRGPVFVTIEPKYVIAVASKAAIV